jgi:adhesin/invasin
VADDDTTQITFTPGGSAAVTAVTTGSGDGSYGVPGGAETLTVAGGQASVVLTDLVAETFAVDVANDAGLANPPADSIQVSAAAAAELVLALPGADFAAGGATAIVVEVRDAFGNTLAGDGVTQVGFAPSGSAAIAAVTTGSGDGSYGVPGGAETLTVAGGVAAVSLTDLVAESVAVAFSNDAGVASPPADSIEVSAAAADRVVLVQAGADFEVGGGTTLSVQVQDAFGNPVVSDEATGIGFAPSGSGTIADVTTGTGDGSYGVPGGSETVQVAGGAATIALTDPVAETFEVTFSNDAGLSNPESDAIAVSRSDGGVPPALVPSSGPFGLLVLGGLLVGTALRRVRQLHRRAGRPA